MLTQSSRQDVQWLPVGELISQANFNFRARDPSLTETNPDAQLGTLVCERPDYHLSQALTWDLHEYTVNHSSTAILDYALSGLSSSNPALVESTWALASQITFEWLKNKGRPCDQPRRWRTLAIELQHTPPLYALGQREQAVLAILARKAAADISDYVAIYLNQQGKPMASITIWGKQLDQLIDQLTIVWPKYKLGGVVSFSAIAQDMKSTKSLHGKCVPWGTERYRIRLALALNAACGGLWRIIDAENHDFDSIRSVLSKAAGLSKTAWTLIHDARISAEKKAKNTDGTAPLDAYISVQGLWSREQDLLKTAAQLLSILGHHGEAAVFAAGALMSPPTADAGTGTRLRNANGRSEHETEEMILEADISGGNSSTLLDSDPHNPVINIASGACVSRLVAQRVAVRWPFCAVTYWRRDPSCQEHYAAIHAVPRPRLEGRAELLVDAICAEPDKYPSDQREAAFELALDQGRPSVALLIAIGKRPKLRSYRRRDRVPIILTRNQVLRVAYQISALLQQTALVANVERQGALRTLFRRVWRDFFEGNPDGDLAPHEVLFIHEIKRGMLEPVLQTFHSPNELRKMRYGGKLIEQHQRGLFDIAARRLPGVNYPDLSASIILSGAIGRKSPVKSFWICPVS